ncbi:ribonuclease H1, putative [Ixodes scapularis]|uniref:ribonuclease H n=1 Tax=Ixodes scapularis TaxID=6945 RepID=B7QGQ7_IXOSC|nr:ribonuclease H1, putative [Ixodes scapularis]|eukprot:XP_002400516.1 ribonuclease H1, putative [Ixodes scapularis]
MANAPASGLRFGGPGCEYHVYTDGACSNNGGYNRTPQAGIGVYWGPNHPMNVSEPLPGRQTNNRAEIQAATRALYQVREQGGRNVTVHTDSDFLVKSTTQWMEIGRKTEGSTGRHAYSLQ